MPVDFPNGNHDCPCCGFSTHGPEPLCTECIGAGCEPNRSGFYDTCSQEEPEACDLDPDEYTDREE